MELQVQPNRWSCMPTSFAMVAQLDVADFIKKIGHDGSEVIHPNELEPRGRRSFTIEEMIYAAYHSGVICSLYHNSSVYSNDSHDQAIIDILDAIINQDYSPDLVDRAKIIRGDTHIHSHGVYVAEMMQKHDGVLLLSDDNHAVAWDSVSERVFDPRGLIYPLKRYLNKIEGFVVCIKISD